MTILSEKRSFAVATTALALTVTAVLVPAPASASPPTTTVMASENRTGGPGNGISMEPSVSADGRYVTFASNSTNLIHGDTNNWRDIFVRDLRTGSIVRASLGAGGVQANGVSDQPAISGNGRFVAFGSFATNLVPGDTNRQPDVFVRDLRTGVTRMVSVGRQGAKPNGDNAMPAMSANGRYIAFVSSASNLVAGDTNGVSDIFVRDMKIGVTRRVSVSSDGVQANDGHSDGPGISADGRFVVFDSAATNLVPGDTNGVTDVFVRDLIAGTTRRVSVGGGGAQADGATFQPAISADGKHVAFTSQATNLAATDTDAAADVLVRSLVTGVNTQVSFRTDSLPGSYAAGPAISADGNLVTFVTASDLVPADTNSNQDIYLRDVGAATNELISADLSGDGAGADTADASISASGNRVAFSSSVGTLVTGDTNGRDDVFVRLR